MSNHFSNSKPSWNQLFTRDQWSRIIIRSSTVPPGIFGTCSFRDLALRSAAVFRLSASESTSVAVDLHIHRWLRLRSKLETETKTSTVIENQANNNTKKSERQKEGERERERERDNRQTHYDRLLVITLALCVCFCTLYFRLGRFRFASLPVLVRSFSERFSVDLFRTFSWFSRHFFISICRTCSRLVITFVSRLNSLCVHFRFCLFFRFDSHRHVFVRLDCHSTDRRIWGTGRFRWKWFYRPIHVQCSIHFDQFCFDHNDQFGVGRRYEQQQRIGVLHDGSERYSIYDSKEISKFEDDWIRRSRNRLCRLRHHFATKCCHQKVDASVSECDACQKSVSRIQTDEVGESQEHYWTAECFHATTDTGRVSGCLFGDGTDGRQSLSGDSNGLGSRAHVLPSLSDAVRHKAFAQRRDHPSRLKTVQHCRQKWLHAQNTWLWPGSYGRYEFHDDTVRGDTLLSGAGSHTRNGIHRKRRHLVGRLYHGRNDSRFRSVSRHRSHRSVEQDHRSAWHSVSRVHAAAAAYCAKLRRKSSAIQRMQFRTSISQ